MTGLVEEWSLVWERIHVPLRSKSSCKLSLCRSNQASRPRVFEHMMHKVHEVIGILFKPECVMANAATFRGDSDCCENEKIVFLDLCNLLGISVSLQFNPMLSRTGVNSPPEAVWRTLSIRRRIVRAAIGDELSGLDRNLMASWLKYRLG